MNNLYVEETTVYVENHNTEQEKGFHGGSVEPYLTCFTTTGQLYRSCLKQYGRCTGKIYVDTDTGTHQVGWIFFKKAPDKEHYDAFTWITVYTTPPTKKVEWVGAEYPTFKKERAHVPATHPQ